MSKKNDLFLLSSAGSPSVKIVSFLLIVIGLRSGHRAAINAFGRFFVNYITFSFSK